MPSHLADFDTLGPAATLAAVEGALEERRAAVARAFALAAHWADLHASHPQLGRGGRRVWAGEDRLVQVGGDGTPQVQNLCLSELAISRRVHHHSARAVVADARDLRHRLPSWWAAVQNCALRPGSLARLRAWPATSTRSRQGDRGRPRPPRRRPRRREATPLRLPLHDRRVRSAPRHRPSPRRRRGLARRHDRTRRRAPEAPLPRRYDEGRPAQRGVRLARPTRRPPRPAHRRHR